MTRVITHANMTGNSWENYMPAARMALYQQGIEYVPVFPTCSKQNKSRQLIMNIGYT